VSDRRVIDAAVSIAVGSQVSSAQKLKILRSIDKYDRLGADGVVALLTQGRRDDSGDFTPGAGLEVIAAKELLNIMFNPGSTGAEGVAQFDGKKSGFLKFNLNHPGNPGQDAVYNLEKIEEIVGALGVSPAAWKIDTSIVRGLEYYTSTVFEVEIKLTSPDGTRFGSIGGGGRYDDLVSRFKGQPIPATGMSIGVSRLATALAAAGRLETEADGPIVVLVMDQSEIAESMALAAELRAAGLAAEPYLGGGGMKAQLKYADKRAAPVAVIVGPDERAKGVVALKNLKLGEALSKTLGDDRAAWDAARTRTQREVPRANLTAEVRRMLEETP
jgi:histidyl-tRNA synthetase